MIKIFNRLFVFIFVWIIFQTVIVLSYTYGQANNEAIEQEFYILCKEVLLKLLSKENGERILKGQIPQPEDPLDMDLSFIWWESSLIFQEELWDNVNPEWGMTYGDKYKDITELPPLDGLQQLKALGMYEPISKKPLDDIPEVDVEGIRLPTPDLAWSPPMTWKPIIPGYDSSELSKRGKWEYKQREPWRKDALVSVAAGAVSLAGYFLNKHSKPIEFFAEWPPQSPACWTACAAGEPKWNKPPLPNSGEKMTPEEWRQHPELHGWYLTPRIKERTPRSKEVYDYSRDVCFFVSIDYAARALWKYFHKREVFPE